MGRRSKWNQKATRAPLKEQPRKVKLAPGMTINNLEILSLIRKTTCGLLWRCRCTISDPDGERCPNTRAATTKDIQAGRVKMCRSHAALKQSHKRRALFWTNFRLTI